MKLARVLSVAALVLSVSAFADTTNKKPAHKKPMMQEADEAVSGQGYGMAGCGLGSIAFGDKQGTTQIFAATTNGTFGSQTFGISSGTSNCDQEITATKKNASAFIFANREALEKDIARGSGETLSGLSQVMGCSDSTILGSKLQGNFQQIFPSEDVGTDHVVDSILKDVRLDPRVAAHCSSIS